MRRVLRRLRPGPNKGDVELRWWLQVWDRVLRDGGLYGPDTLRLSGDETTADTYDGRRRQQARAEVARVLEEAELPPDFFAGRRVLDIGSGPVGFPDGCAEVAAASFSAEPLADRYAEAGLLIQPSDATYFATGAEAVPLPADSVDVVVARNSLDHVDDPRAVIAEVKRLLRPGGTFILNVDVEHTPTTAEPHSLALDELRKWLAPLRVESERVWDRPHGHDGHAVVLVVRASGPA